TVASNPGGTDATNYTLSVTHGVSSTAVAGGAGSGGAAGVPAFTPPIQPFSVNNTKATAPTAVWATMSGGLFNTTGITWSPIPGTTPTKWQFHFPSGSQLPTAETLHWKATRNDYYWVFYTTTPNVPSSYQQFGSRLKAGTTDFVLDSHGNASLNFP